MARERILLVGESNPHSVNPRFALYPNPPGSAGWRLCRKILRMDPGIYLEEFDRVNLVNGEWDRSAAKEAASKLTHSLRVLLGRRVCEAHGIDYSPFWLFIDAGRGRLFLVLPHPSGRCRTWNEGRAIEDAARGIEALRDMRDQGGI